MRFISTAALTVALALGTAAAQPAMAKDKSSSNAPLKLSDAVRTPVVASQEALKKGDTAGALASVNQAKSAAQTPDEKLVVGQQIYAVGQATKDNAQQAEGIDMMLQSGKVPADNQASYYVALGKLSYTTNNFQKADAAFTQALALNTTDSDVYALLAESKNKLGKPAEAVALIQKVAEQQQAKGTPVPQEWLQRGINIGLTAKVPGTTALTYDWLAGYSTKSNWRDSLVIYRQINKVDPETDLDFNRLQRTAGALKGERDFTDYAEQTYIKYPGEAKAVIDEGVSAGMLNLASMKGAKELQGIAASKIAQDKASLNKNPATGKAALANADAYAGYGDYASAISLYKAALSKGGVDANVVNTRLGAALYKSGDKDGAKQAFSAVTGPRADLAKYWLILIDHPVAG